MSILGISYTTNSAAIAKDANEIALTAVTGVVNGDILVIRGEAMKVDSSTITTAVTKVIRGWQGTRQKSHPTGKRVYHAPPDEWKRLHDNALGLLGDSGDLPEFLLPGQEALDDDGNEYVMIEATAKIYRGCTAIIGVANQNYTAAPLSTGTHGPVGVAPEIITSTDFGWLQIKGGCSAQQAMPDTAATSAYYAVAATSVSTPDAGLYTVSLSSTEWYRIKGMFLTGVSSSATTSLETGSKETGGRIPVWLHYPYVETGHKPVMGSAS